MKPFYEAFARLGLAAPSSSSSSVNASSNIGYGNLRTEDVTLISHTHGRERRAQRGIEKEALKKAVKDGKRSRANGGRNGEVRWRFEYNGIVYVTDSSCKQEITSWRVNGGEDGPPADFIQHVGDVTTHTILVVDHSGSMRKNDVPGFGSRTEAVYEAVASQFIQPQLNIERTHLATTTTTSALKTQRLGEAIVSLIEMGEDAKVVFKRLPLNQDLYDYIKRRKNSYARSHGNYVPSLDALDALLTEDLATDTPILILFLSDGAPSDHTVLTCKHGVNVWDEDTDNPRLSKARDGTMRPALRECGYKNCRSELKRRVEVHIRDFVSYIGDRYGRDRVRLHTVAFGSPTEDYKMLQEMAACLPQGSFQKLGLAASSLHTALSTLTSTLTSLRTDGGSLRRTVRDFKTRSGALNASAPNNVGSVEDVISDEDNSWGVYLHPASHINNTRVDTNFWIAKKIRYSATKKEFITEPMSEGADCVAVESYLLDKGAERVVFRCGEGRVVGGWRQGEMRVRFLGKILVAKESIHQEELLDMGFHSKMCKLHAKSQQVCDLFNKRIAFLGPSHLMNYVQPVIYEVTDPMYPAGKAWILAEERLEGKFTKWNNNAGGVRKARADQVKSVNPINRDLGAIFEEDEEEGDEDEEGEDDRIEISEIPQCFSHFSWSVSDGQQLVCDVQGIWNEVDGFLLTDPVIHDVRKKNGMTDRGRNGIDNFFKSHICGPLCQRLGLKTYDAMAAARQALTDISSSSPIKPSLSSANRRGL